MNNKIRRWYRVNQVFGGILLSLLLALTFQHYYLLAVEPPPGLLSINTISFTPITDPVNSNPGISSRQQRSLPDDWLHSSPGVSEGWYQAKIDIEPTPAGLWAIYLPVIQMSAEIYFNDFLVGQIGELGGNNPYGDPFVRSAYQPHYLTLPENLLKPGSNLLKIRVQAARGSGLLGKIYVAADKDLRPVFNVRYSTLITSKQTITAGMLAIAILMTVLWMLRRQDSVYGWYALMLFTWSAHNIFSMGMDIPLTAHAQNIIALLALGWFVVFMVIATHHYMGQQFRTRERVIYGAAIIGSLGIIFASSLPWSLLVTHQIWSTMVLNLAGYALIDFCVKYRDREDLQNPLIIPAGFSMLIFGLHDWLLIMQVIPRDDGRLLHFSAPLAVSVFGALLLERFAKTLRRAESLNLELEQRVEEKHRELEANYQKLKKMENQRLLSDERERFTKEIHDGVGGHLISMLSMVRSGKQDTDILIHAIETTLDDLRIMIDSLTPEQHDIPSLLGAMRTRIEPQLESSGLKLRWQVSELPAISNFGPHKALQVMRIVQEAITNAIRHAQAENIVIRTFVDNSDNVTIEVADDGAGVHSEAKHGRGLTNMKFRAKEIGAHLDIRNASPGTVVSLNLPKAEYS